MLAFFRRALGSWIVVALLGLIMVAFIVTGVGSPSGLGGFTGPGAYSVATVDGKAVPTADLVRDAQNQLSQARQQQPTLDMNSFLAAVGGVGPLVEQAVTSRVLEAWAARHGIVASDRLVDGEIASIPAFAGPTGKFDETRMRAILAQQRIGEAALRDGIRGDLIRRQLLVPMGVGTAPSARLMEPYAGVLAANREGLVGLIPAKPEAVKPPTDADIAAWYKGHIAAYSLPERRVLRYAPLEAPAVAPTDAEIAAQYKADAAKYAASETRTLSQVILPDEATAKAFAAKVAGGVPFATAATQAGFAAKDIALGEQSKEALAALTSNAVAAAAFAAKAGSTTAPVKSVLGWHVLHVDAVDAHPARSLEQARPEIVAALTKKKQADALAALGTKIGDALADGATFDEVVKKNGLKVVTTPPLTAAGTVPGQPDYKPDAAVTALLKPGFVAGVDDDATLESTGPGSGAVLDVVRVDAPAPVPLAAVRDRIVKDLVATQAATAARKTAQALLDRINKGDDMAAAFKSAGLEAPKPLAGSQMELSRLPQVPPAARTLFQLPPGRAAIAPAPNGWFVIKVVTINPPAPQIVAAIAGQMRADVGRALGQEYVEQFARAAAAEVTVKRNPQAIADLRRQLTGQAPADNGQ